MHVSFRHTASIFLLAGLVAGCANLGAGSKEPGVKADADHAKAPRLSKQRLMLSEGYSMLYRDASQLDLAELLLYVKVESEAVDKIVTAVAEVGGQLKKDLEKIAKDYPGVRIDLDPLPEMEKRKRSAIAKDRARYFAPVIGHGGREYERTLLIGYVNGINHERHLCQVMAEAEPEASLKNSCSMPRSAMTTYTTASRRCWIRSTSRIPTARRKTRRFQSLDASMSTAFSYCQVTLVGLENGKRFKTIRGKQI